MRIAFYSDAGLDQIVLTPETEVERSMLGKIHEPGVALKIHKGTFYACVGGWTRHGARSQDESTILVLAKDIAS